MNNINSWNEAQKRIAQLQKAITEQQRQLKEIESHTVEFVDNPKNPINHKEVIGDTDIIYIPTGADRKQYPMKKEDLDRHFDEAHMPLYFTNEHSCMLFNSIFTVLKDMLKFKTRIYDTGDMWGRKTRLSHVIDKFKLNELPQLFNVLQSNREF